MTKPTTVVTGNLIEAPIEDATQRGSRFVAARVREDSKSGREWRVVGYSDYARAELAKRPAGAFIAVAGTFDASILTPEGETAPKLVRQLTASMFVALAQDADREESAP
jgi:hypothetical protein